ncbi:uncharacterized protein PHACADRAFT_130574 [Phanerochaete carnosa HHB-10118-sp]|uniref:Zn(2)-C6 fungal-type domain-containing protein n=1 Tax=Phanerochaete carnosa (strain HHB-10118-sp) TaxID=650164 RepID=K5VTC6_PHACS|nr:uncharacterized protein PHACADRAFT_130574 [Phanerochaete carnosa HHB-10118-sp]EKM50050.1 hypothetical protein PHACADRAFT_130574 [Phanerochaete carnosa HHB-10118-sp]
MSPNNSPPLAPQYQPGPAAYMRAPKGKACLNCRRRKLKCDCAHPVCSQCVRLGREGDCEYSEKDQKTRTEILEEHVAALKARIVELEGAANGGAGVSHADGFASWPGLLDDDDFADLAGTSHDARHSGGSHGSSPELTGRGHSIPTYPEAQILLDAFLPHAQEVGFFLNTARFLSKVSQQLSGLSSVVNSLFDTINESDPLLSAVYVWGAALTSDEDLRVQQSAYLAKAVRQVSELGPNKVRTINTPTAQPNVLHIIQAHVLLANYFYNAGQFAEGRRHTADAVSLVVLYRLHKIRSPTPHDRSKMSLAHAADEELAMRPAADLIEEGERIHAFWQVCILDKTWAVVLGCPSLMVADDSLGAEIDTPWPLATEQYRDGTLPLDYGSTGQTIQSYLSAHDVLSSSGSSPLGLRARASALLYRASWYASSGSTDPAARERHATSFETTENLLDRFILSLPSLEAARSQLAPEVHRHLAVTHCLARLAIVQLHWPFYDDELNSAAKIMSACKAIVVAAETVPASILAHVDPLLPIILTTPPRVIATELVRVVASNVTVYKRPHMFCVNPHIMAAHIDETIGIMRRVNRDSRLTVLQLEAVNTINSALVGTEFQRP